MLSMGSTISLREPIHGGVSKQVEHDVTVPGRCGRTLQVCSPVLLDSSNALLNGTATEGTKAHFSVERW